MSSVEGLAEETVFVVGNRSIWKSWFLFEVVVLMGLSQKRPFIEGLAQIDGLFVEINSWF